MYKGVNLFVAAPKTGDVSDMQYYYDKCLPGNSTILNEYDAVTMQIRENSLNVKDCVLDMSKSVPLPRESETTLKPVIRTAAEKPRKPGLLENLVAMIKRNFNSPELVGVVDIEDTASLVVDKFFDAYLIKEKKKPKNIPLLSRASLERWIEKQYLHIITHNLLGASLIGCLAFLIGKPISEWVLRFILKYRDWRISWKTAAASALIGSYSHILLDTFMHHDVYFFYPWILKNPLANLIPYSALFYSCIFMAIIGTSICLYQLKFKNKRT